jgi:nucleotide-binding universal stress UspA family protein/hemerythrin-like domain-containing protein
MYRHLFVPVDGTDLSVETVGQAVEFASTLGARITFFHAQPDHAASLFGEAEIARVAAPEEFVYAFEGRARELLAKAESAARALGVPCNSISTVSDTPHEAILAAARDAKSDLIFMASHGRRTTIGMMLGSQMLKVLAHTEIPVLVAATRNPAMPAHAIGIIRDEHRSLAAVLHAWMNLMATARRQGTCPDPALLRAIVHYIETFPVALHHPKEDEYLFRKLRSRTTSVDAELDELERQHERDRQMVAELAAMIESLIGDQGGGQTNVDIATVEQAVKRYASFMWEHLGREEGVILPAAQRHLTDEDWAEIDAAFVENDDPRFGHDADVSMRHLFSRIVNLSASSSASSV